MDGITDLFDKPGYYILEFILLGMVLYLFFDLKASRKAIYDKIESLGTMLMAQIKEVKTGLDDHEKACLEERAENREWRGRTDERMKHLEEDK